MGRHLDRHLNSHELRALAPWPADEIHENAAYSAAAFHVLECRECAEALARYRKIISAQPEVAASRSTLAGHDCPGDVDWYEVAAGLWPELKTQQLIMHGASCDHCGPLLRAAASLQTGPSAEEERFLAGLAAPARPPSTRAVPARGLVWTFAKWAIPAAVALVTVFLVLAPPTPLSGASYAEIATNTHERHLQGSLPLQFRSDSQQQLNEWLKVNLPFPVALPGTSEIPGQNRPYRLEGARLVEVGGKPAVYISYVSQNDPVSLLVTPDSVAHASGGATVDYKKVSFHYRMVAGYKVVTWSLKGRTYALVSHESNTTQRSCMVCHAAMGDRDLTQTPAPLAERIAKPAF